MEALDPAKGNPSLFKTVNRVPRVPSTAQAGGVWTLGQLGAHGVYFCVTRAYT